MNAYPDSKHDDGMTEGRRPRIFFEECAELASDPRWISELVELAGGEVCADPTGGWAARRCGGVLPELARFAPDIIIGCPCDKEFEPDIVAARAGWKNTSAVRNGEIYKIESSLLLQPGPLALTQGLEQLVRIVQQWREHRTKLFQTAISAEFGPQQPPWAPRPDIPSPTLDAR